MLKTDIPKKNGFGQRVEINFVLCQPPPYVEKAIAEIDQELRKKVPKIQHVYIEPEHP